MGTVPQEKQIELIDGYLSSLKKEKKYLEDILDSIFDSKLTEHLSVQQELDSEEKNISSLHLNMDWNTIY